MSATLRKTVFETLDTDPKTAPSLYWITVALVVLIGLNVAAVVLETVVPIRVQFQRAFDLFEVASLAIFSVEYVLRLWSCVEDPRYAHPFHGRLRYLVSPMAIVDLASIFPSILLVAAIGGIDLRFLRALRFFRLFRVLKLGRYSKAVHTLGEVIYDSRAELAVALGAVGILLIISSSVMYLAENEAQPEKFSSIPATMWWSIITLTTIGYGDVVPITTLGKVMGGVTALMGVGIVALPTAILGAGFIEHLRTKREAKRCPHCGELLHDAAPNAAPK